MENTVKVIGVEPRTNHTNNTLFYVLLLAGGLYSATSRTTNKTYTSILTATVPVPENIPVECAKILIGTEMKGHIERRDCAAREFVGKDGKKYTSLHDNVFVAE
jgi:hypothetical protein